MSSLGDIQVPDGWKRYDFGALATKIVGGGTPSRKVPEYWNGKIPWATVKDLTGTYLTETEESISEKGLAESASNLIPTQTVIIATRMALGKAVVYDKDVAINQDLKAVFPKKNLDWQYLLHWYQSRAKYIESMGSGSTVKGVRLEDLKIIPIILPPLPEQKKIASILTSVDDVIEKTEAQTSKLQDLKKGMMTELLTKGIGHTEFKDSPIGKIPVSWKRHDLGELISKIIGGGTPSRKVPEYWNGKIPWATIKDLTETYPKFTEENISKKGLVESASNLIPANTIIIATRMALGKVVVFDKDVAINQDLKAIFPKKNLNNEFLLHWYQSQSNYIDSMGSGSTVKGIRLEDLKQIPINLPPLSEQKEIASILTSIGNNIESKQNKLTQIKSLKKALMNDLLTGKVRVDTTSTTN